ncbi:MAG: glucose 1-dehydrogenase [Deltaproteobacteria bacterium]|nr:glucose 1-dehydrogenase [Deltaproteobacteria bacterium]
MGRLEGKVAVITGGSSGIGAATARLFAREGAGLVIADILDEQGQNLATELGDKAIYRHTNVIIEEEVQAAVNLAMEKYGRLDCMFNNAGLGGTGGPIEETDMAGFDITVAILFKGVMLGMKHAARVMIPQGFGNIISTASVAGHKTGFGGHTYSACKAAIIHLTRSVAMQLGEFGIRVNCVCPGGIVTPIFGRALGLTEEDIEKTLDPIKGVFKNIQALPRAGLPEDVAKAVLFLAGDDSDFINGEALQVDGGVGRGFLDKSERGGQRDELLVALGLDPAIIEQMYASRSVPPKG